MHFILNELEPAGGLMMMVVFFFFTLIQNIDFSGTGKKKEAFAFYLADNLDSLCGFQ